jgi:DNA-binding beta-propeller fold protein YncE
VPPFTGLESLQDVAVDTAGNVYVSDLHHVKDDNGSSDVTIPVIKLAAGSNTQTALPQFVHASLMADAAGAVWVVDAGNEQLVKLVAGSTTQPRCRFPTLAYTARFMQWIPLATRTAPTAVVSIPMGRAALLSTW